MGEAKRERFLDHQCGIAAGPGGLAVATLYGSGGPRTGKSAGKYAGGANDPDYLTNLSNGRRRWPCGDFGSCDRSAGASSGGVIASHKAFSSESAIRLSFIRNSRI